MAIDNGIKEASIDKIRTLKAKASDLTNKLRSKVNLLIDAVNKNNSKLNISQTKEESKGMVPDYDILKDKRMAELRQQSKKLSSKIFAKVMAKKRA